MTDLYSQHFFESTKYAIQLFYYFLESINLYHYLLKHIYLKSKNYIFTK